jgi:transposase
MKRGSIQRNVLKYVGSGMSISAAAKKAGTNYSYAYKIVSTNKNATTTTTSNSNNVTLYQKLTHLNNEIKRLSDIRDYLTA